MFIYEDLTRYDTMEIGKDMKRYRRKENAYE